MASHPSTAEELAPPRVSVIVCGHDGEATAPALVAALARQTMSRERFEVVYVDDASADRTVEIFERSGIARIVRSPGRVGLPRARNLGIAAARADLLAFTDVDTVPDDGWLERGCDRFASADVQYLAGGISIPVGRRPTIAALVDATTFLDQETYVTTGYAAGANFWVRRGVIDRCGGFNEDLEYYGGDDEEFGWRLSAAGARPVYAPEVHLTHPPRRRLRDIARKAYRLGWSHAARRRVDTGALSGQSPVYTRPIMYVPPRRLHRLPRVAELDYVPTVFELLQMHLVRYLCVQLMMVVGDFAGERRHRRTEAPPPR